MGFFRHSSASKRRTINRRPSLAFSLTGLIYVALMLFMGIAAINSQANLLFGMFGLMVGVLLISGVISRIVLRGMKLERQLPEHACVGDVLTVSYQFTNTKRFWPSLSIMLAELDAAEAFTRQPHCFLLHAAASKSESVPMALIPKRRGLHRFNRYQLITSFPFGFVKRAVMARRQDGILIYPAIAHVSPQLLSMCRAVETTGELSQPRPGGADEFYGVREYRAGDNPKWIYWRRSASAGTLVLKEMTRVSPPRILLLVDTYLAARALADHAAVEKCIAMAASLAATALEQGLSVGLCAWTGQSSSITPRRGKRHKADLLSVLASLPLNTQCTKEDLVRHARPVVRSGTTAVLFTPKHDVIDGSLGFAGTMMTIAADSARARSFFKFDSKIDFSACMPIEQEPN